MKEPKLNNVTVSGAPELTWRANDGNPYSEMVFTGKDICRDNEGNMSALTFHAHSEVVLLIKQDGSIFWRGREVESDDDFKAAMLDLSKSMRALCGVGK